MHQKKCFTSVLVTSRAPCASIPPSVRTLVAGAANRREVLPRAGREARLCGVVSIFGTTTSSHPHARRARPDARGGVAPRAARSAAAADGDPPGFAGVRGVRRVRVAGPRGMDRRERRPARRLRVGGRDVRGVRGAARAGVRGRARRWCARRLGRGRLRETRLGAPPRRVPGAPRPRSRVRTIARLRRQPLVPRVRVPLPQPRALAPRERFQSSLSFRVEGKRAEGKRADHKQRE